MKKLVIFGGTTEGRELSCALAAEGIQATVWVATPYGSAQQGRTEGLTVCTGRLDRPRMEEVLTGAALCVDATHPYAVEASVNIRAACAGAGVEYLRLLRPASPLPPDALDAPDASGAVRLLEQTQGPVLVATGGKELAAFAPLGGERLYARVLPTHASLDACAAAGIPAGHIIAMQGPFSAALNRAMLEQYGIRWLVTKDGGAPGGFAEKADAARAAGARLVVIRRPREAGASYQAVLARCREVMAP